MEQVAQAKPHPRIDYRAAPAEASGLPNRSCDLVTVAQALHWFCNDSFYAEVKRVLKQDGLFAAWTYTLLQGEPDLNAIVHDFYANTVGSLVATRAALGRPCLPRYALCVRRHRHARL